MIIPGMQLAALLLVGDGAKRVFDTLEEHEKHRETLNEEKVAQSAECPSLP